MDFVSDALFNGKRFRALTVVDAYTRECLAIHADQGIKGEQVVDVMDRLLFERGSPPAKIRVDNGPEFISQISFGLEANGRSTLRAAMTWRRGRFVRRFRPSSR
jgi:transposase InsO family protein